MGTISNRFLVNSFLAVCFSCSPTITFAQDAPNKVDIQSAYCLPFLGHMFYRYSMPLEEGASEEQQQLTAELHDKYLSNIKLIQAYLLPRVSGFSSSGLETLGVTRKKVEDDLNHEFSDAGSCFNTCNNQVCLAKCTHNSEAGLRLKRCDDLTFLPH